MILIADSGSTKTQWTLLNKGNVMDNIMTAGMNPYFIGVDSVVKILKEDLVPKLDTSQIKEIHFYGSGCSTEKNNTMLAESMRKFFPDTLVFIYHDILGAARALFGKEKGIACILGTGCNSCYYDGEEVYSKVPSVGYLFGDEGAGSNLGKRLMESYLKDRMPQDLRKDFEKTYPMTLEDILNALYNKPFPNRFLASFSEFIAPRKDHPFLNKMISDSFDSFFVEQVMKYDGYDKMTVSFIGSIAWIYKDILLESAASFGIHTGLILKSPMEGLVRYHTRS
ncbi:MAG: N-acetylglucosamine kinase [Bacteroidota bacterium]|nr:N-acetylglucosamine kinase [Bacteroidota bacterium]